MRGSKPQIHGHRGARGRRPENSLSAIRYAMNCGADGIEVDLCVTADNEVIVHHDLFLSQNIARDTTGAWTRDSIPIRALTLAALKEYDVGRLRPGTDYASRFPHQRAQDGETVPTLIEFIETVLEQGSAEVMLNLEMKGQPERPDLLPPPEQYVDAVLSLIDAYDIAHRTYLQSFDWKLALLARERMPALNVGLLTDGQPEAKPRLHGSEGHTVWTNGLHLADYQHSVPRMVSATGCATWSTHYRDLTHALVKEAKQLGLGVYVWTVNDLDDVERMADWGVDVITTDYPDRLVDLLSRSGSFCNDSREL